MTDLTDDGSRRAATMGDERCAGDEGRLGAPASVHSRTLSCRTVATSQFRQRHRIRDLEPSGSGAAREADATLLGEEQEPHPLEMLLAALGACLTASIQANAVARGIPLRTLEVHGRGDVDPSALWGTGPRQAMPLGFQSIAIDVHIEADVPREVLKALVDHAVLWSPVANTLHDPVDLVVSLAEHGHRTPVPVDDRA